jgi:hypothetical protein
MSLTASQKQVIKNYLNKIQASNSSELKKKLIDEEKENFRGLLKTILGKDDESLRLIANSALNITTIEGGGENSKSDAIDLIINKISYLNK